MMGFPASVPYNSVHPNDKDYDVNTFEDHSSINNTFEKYGCVSSNRPNPCGIFLR